MFTPNGDVQAHQTNNKIGDFKILQIVLVDVQPLIPETLNI